MRNVCKQLLLPLGETDFPNIYEILPELTLTCSKSIIETLEKSVKYVQSFYFWLWTYPHFFPLFLLLALDKQILAGILQLRLQQIWIDLLSIDKFYKICRKTPATNSAFSKVANLKPINFAKKVFFTGAFLWVFRFFKIDIPHVVTPSLLITLTLFAFPYCIFNKFSETVWTASYIAKCSLCTGVPVIAWADKISAQCFWSVPAVNGEICFFVPTGTWWWKADTLSHTLPSGKADRPAASLDHRK